MQIIENRLRIFAEYGTYLCTQPFIEFLRLLKPNSFVLFKTQEDHDFMDLQGRIALATLANKNPNEILEKEINNCYEALLEEENRLYLNLSNKPLEEMADFIAKGYTALKESELSVEIDEEELKQLGLDNDYLSNLLSSPILNQEIIGLNISNISFDQPIEQLSETVMALFNVNMNSIIANEKVEMKIIKMWFKNQYLMRLLREKDNLVNKLQLEEDLNFEKIEWQGTQKELAELFLELKRKKWIKEIPTNLIKQYFTKSNSIRQVLKPTQDSRTKEETYEGIYAPEYKPKFDLIRPKA